MPFYNHLILGDFTVLKVYWVYNFAKPSSKMYDPPEHPRKAPDPEGLISEVEFLQKLPVEGKGDQG